MVCATRLWSHSSGMAWEIQYHYVTVESYLLEAQIGPLWSSFVLQYYRGHEYSATDSWFASGAAEVWLFDGHLPPPRAIDQSMHCIASRRYLLVNKSNQRCRETNVWSGFKVTKCDFCDVTAGRKISWVEIVLMKSKFHCLGVQNEKNADRQTDGRADWWKKL